MMISSLKEGSFCDLDTPNLNNNLLNSLPWTQNLVREVSTNLFVLKLIIYVS